MPSAAIKRQLASERATILGVRLSYKKEAIDYIRKLRPGSIGTEEEEAVIYEYENTRMRGENSWNIAR